MPRPATLLLALLTVLATSGAVHAQDLFGFDRGSFGNVVLNRNQSAGGEIELELAVGSYNNESIRNYSPDSVFARMGQAVGRLDILTDKGVFPCTAFIVSDKHILTNHHCVPGILGNEKAGATRIDAVQFVAGYTQQGVDEGTRKYTVIPVPVETSKELDYSVLEVLGDPSEVYGKLALSDREPRDGDPYWVIGHPMGEAQRISREKCKANTPALSQSRLLHTCDTLPGNSGSPVIDASLQRVIGLHHAGSKRDSVNFAIPMREILSQSTLLAALVQPEAATRTDAVAGGGGGGAAADAGTCDAFYNEAKALGQCFAYEAYVESCASHPYIRFAQGYLKSNCAAPPADAPVDVASAPKTPEALLRPWCGSSRMNLTERTICDTPALADLDAEMEAAYYGQSGRATSAQQNAWRTGTRDACGADTNCIYRAVSERITYLRSPNGPAPAGPRMVAGNYDLGSGRCYLITASRPTLAEAEQFIGQWFRGRSDIEVFRSENGWFAVSAGILPKAESEGRLARLKAQGSVPQDSYCSSGNRFREKLLRTGSAGATDRAPGGGGRIIYVDNNSDGGLNVRPGPGTQYPYFTEIDPGTALTLLGASGKWSNVRLPDGRTGWVYTPLLTWTKPRVQQCMGQVINLRPRAQYNLSTGAGFLAVRTKPSTGTGQKISELYLGDRVRVVARQGGWARLECLSGGCTAPYQGTAGVRGWSSAKYLSITCN
jgi:V8-like Glu-specific endopeptidase